MVEKIDEDTADCLQFVVFEGASCEDSSSSFNLGQLTKRIHDESDEFDEKTHYKPVHTSMTADAISFGVANRVHIHLKPMCGIVVVAVVVVVVVVVVATCWGRVR